jgi:catechol 2,3-dioxygenase
MPAGTTVGHIHLHVADLHAARAFYADALGFDVAVSSYPGALFLSAGGYHHHLGVNVWAGPGAVPPGPDDAQLLDWELLLPPADLAAAARRVTAAGCAARETADGWHTADPSGTTLRLTATGEP